MNQEWLDSLKEGDEVALKTYTGWGRAEPNYKVTKVIKITPTRRIKVEAYGNLQFDSKGRPFGSSMRDVKLMPYGQEVKNAIRKNNLIYILDQIKMNDLPLDKIERIAAIIKEDS